MVDMWNAVVKPNDVVYHLGDVVMNRRCLPIVSKLHGDKRLILGNHDIFDNSDYLKYFKRLHGSFKLDDMLLTHIPVHVDSIAGWAVCNVHGHIHSQSIPNPKYFNVSVEQINYTPIALEDLKLEIKNNAAKYAVDIASTDANMQEN